MIPMASLERILISGGGTGGHIHPALAIADEIRRRYPDCAIHFVGAKGRMEMEKVPAAGYPIDGLWISGVDRNWRSVRNLAFPLKLLSSLWRAGALLRRRPRRPHRQHHPHRQHPPHHYIQQDPQHPQHHHRPQHRRHRITARELPTLTATAVRRRHRLHHSLHLRYLRHRRQFCLQHRQDLQRQPQK